MNDATQTPRSDPKGWRTLVRLTIRTTESGLISVSADHPLYLCGVGRTLAAAFDSLVAFASEVETMGKPIIELQGVKLTADPLADLLDEATKCRERLDQILSAASAITGENLNNSFTFEAVFDGNLTADELRRSIAENRYVRGAAP
jgi:hypothetical protein